MAKEKMVEEEIIEIEPEPEIVKKEYGGIIPGVILIVLGILFLLPRLGVDFGNLWPMFLLAPGISFIIYYIFSTNKEKSSGILIPGTILVLMSVFFYAQTFSGWANSDKLWPIYPLIVGIAFYVKYLGGFRKDRGILVPANILTAIGIVFLILNYYSFNLWPLILIIVGLAFVLSGMRKANS